jgi:hypothetical protein
MATPGTVADMRASVPKKPGTVKPSSGISRPETPKEKAPSTARERALAAGPMAMPKEKAPSAPKARFVEAKVAPPLVAKKAPSGRAFPTPVAKKSSFQPRRNSTAKKRG